MGLTEAGELLADGQLEMVGDLTALVTLSGLFDQFERRLARLKKMNLPYRAN